MRHFTLSLYAGLTLVSMTLSVAGPIDTIPTTGSFNASYGTASQVSPSIPWSDLGFQATANVSQGTLSGTVGGSTQFQLATSLSGSQAFIPGVTQVNLGYTPAWTGSMSTSAHGSLGVNFVFGIGPLTGSVPVLADGMTTGVAGLNLAGALNASSSLSHSATTPGLGIGGGFGVKAQAFCPFCVTVASASVGFHVGSQVTQNLSVNPDVTYGDLVWFSNGANVTSPLAIVGGAGSVTNTFTAPNFAALGLPSTGGAFDMNILPYTALSLDVGNEAIVSIPASISYSYDVFGVSGSGSAAGDLYALSTGLADISALGTWYAPDIYSIELDGSCTIDPLAETCNYGTIGVPDPVLFTNGGIPPNVPLFNGPPGPPTGGGDSSDFPLLGPLVPGDSGCVPGEPCNPPCDPATGSECINMVTLTRTPVPEPQSGWLMAAALLMLGLLRASSSSLVFRSSR